MKNLWITLLVSVMILGIVIFPKSKKALFEVLEYQVFQGNESLKNHNDVIFKAIEEKVRDYQEYQEYLEHADSVRQTVAIALENENTDLEIVIPKLTRQVKDEYAYEELRKNLDYLNLHSIRKGALNVALSQSKLLYSETALLNYFRAMMRGTGTHWSNAAFLMLNPKNHFCINEAVDLKYTISSISPRDYYDLKIWLNDKPLVLDKDYSYKSSFKLRPTKIGENTFEITIDGRNREGDRERTTKEFEFFVYE